MSRRATLAGQPFVLFEVGSATRRVIDRFFASEKIEPTIVMDTENVEIIKAMVKTGLGIGIVPYQAIAREVQMGQFFCARVEGHELVRETGWVYARANRTPRMIHELLSAFDEIRPQAAPRAAAGARSSNPQILRSSNSSSAILPFCNPAISKTVRPGLLGPRRARRGARRSP